jgi:lysophospholipid acyltransferase (LPLAT)-like uncharacterized protein
MVCKQDQRPVHVSATSDGPGVILMLWHQTLVLTSFAPTCWPVVEKVVSKQERHLAFTVV